MAVLLYIDISFQPSTFFKLLKTPNFGADAFLKKCQGTERASTDFFLVNHNFVHHYDKNQVESNLFLHGLQFK